MNSPSPARGPARRAVLATAGAAGRGPLLTEQLAAAVEKSKRLPV
ncbi:hypothetical protein ACIQ7D_34895 [Streptomyces sp. NPDC096310]